MKIAVTGGIGSGKSYVCRLLEERGISIYDCDKAAKRIISNSQEVKTALINTVGSAVYSNDILDKSVLTSYLLQSEENAGRINSIVHPAVADDFVKSGYSWMECAILFSSGFNRLVDKTICVTAPEEIRIRRIMERDGISEERAYDWIKAQMPQNELLSLCDYEITNDGTADLDRQIDDILEKLNTQ